MSYSLIMWDKLATEIRDAELSKKLWPNGVRGAAFGECIAMIHAEVSEAFASLLLISNDGDLPSYSSFETRLANVIIRLLDLGSYYAVPFENVTWIRTGEPNFASVHEDLCRINLGLSSILLAHRTREADLMRGIFLELLDLVITTCVRYNVSPSILNDKIAFDSKRAPCSIGDFL